MDPISRIVYSATRADVETTIVDGEILMEKGLLKTVDKEVVLREANRSITRLLGKTRLA